MIWISWEILLVPYLLFLSVAEYVTKVHAICVRCGNLAQYSFRKSDEAQVVLLGEKDIYEPLCRHCYNKAINKQKMKLYSADIARIVNGRLIGPPDLPVTEIVTDSRQLSYTEGLLFFAIRGKNHDGHLFIDSLYGKGIRIFVVEREPETSSDYPGAAFIITRNTIEALQLLAAYKRKAFKSHVIAITGSAGKTVVKEWLAEIIGRSSSSCEKP